MNVFPAIGASRSTRKDNSSPILLHIKPPLCLNRRASEYIILSIIAGFYRTVREAVKQRRNHMVTVSIKGVLIGVLLIALIVLVVFLIVLVSNLTDTIKKTNAIIDGGTNAAAGAKEKMDNAAEAVKGGVSKVTGAASGVVSVGTQVAGKVIDKVIK